MALIYADRVQESSTHAAGTGTLNLGGAVLGSQTFVDGWGTGNGKTYCIVQVDGNDSPTGGWEVGDGVVTDASPDTLTRSLIASSTGSLLDLSTEKKFIFGNRAARDMFVGTIENAIPIVGADPFALEEDANLTFDGTDLVVGAGIQFTGAQTLSTSTGDLTISPGGTAGVTITDSQLTTLTKTHTSSSTPFTQFNNPSATGQLPLEFVINSTLRAKFRVDFVGNVNWVSAGGDHVFYTGGDFGTGTQRWAIDASDGSLMAPTGTTVGVTTGTLTLFADTTIAISAPGGSITLDTTAYLWVPTNDASPEYRVGSSDTDEGHMRAMYDSGAQTLDYLLHSTDSSNAAANKGLHRFNVDGTDILDIDDGGLNLVASMGISIAGTDIITDAAGDSTLSNIDNLDATTEATIEAAIDTLTNVTLINPALGTPASGNLSGCSAYEGTAIASTGEAGGTKFLREDGDNTCSWQTPAGGGDMLAATYDAAAGATQVAFRADKLSVFAATTQAELNSVISDASLIGGGDIDTSAELRSFVSDSTGTGFLFFAGGALGTPASGVLTNCTGYVGDSSLVTTGSLDSGSITSNFGTINVGASTITTTGAVGTGALTSTTGVFTGDVEIQAYAHTGNPSTLTVTTNAVTVDLDAWQHPYVDLDAASGTVTMTITATASETRAGTILILQDGTARDVTIAVDGGLASFEWLGDEPTWNGITVSKHIVVSYRTQGTVIYLSATAEQST